MNLSDAAAVYAGTTEAKAVYYGPQLLWNLPGWEPLWSPSQIGTDLWLDSANSTSLIMDGNRVSQWSDLSGNARHGTQSLTTSMPTVTSEGISFDGLDDCLFFPSGFLNGATAFTLAMVMRAPSQQNDAVWGPSTTNSTGLELICTNTAGLPTLLRINNSNKITTGLWSTDNTASLTTIVASPASCLGFKDGSPLPASSGISPISFNGIYAMARYNNNIFGGSNLSAQMEMAEFIILPNAVSTDDREKIEGYLAHKWSLTANLPALHPYKTIAP
jgi:hypothetical protein